jgi:hypothetical protein
MTYAFTLLMASALAIVSTFSARAADRPPNLVHLTQDHVQTCKHYGNRARFQPRDTDVSLEALLADSCDAAVHVIQLQTAGGSQQAAAAQTYLERLTQFRRLIVTMNIERLYGPNPGPRQQPSKRSAQQQVGLGKVTSSGEFLIAHRMGVFQALDAWRDETPSFSLALR